MLLTILYANVPNNGAIYAPVLCEERAIPPPEDGYKTHDDALRARYPEACEYIDKYMKSFYDGVEYRIQFNMVHATPAALSSQVFY